MEGDYSKGHQIDKQQRTLHSYPLEYTQHATAARRGHLNRITTTLILTLTMAVPSSHRLTLTLLHHCPISRSEITQVALSATTALAIYPTPQQSWIDTFALTPSSLHSLSKTSGFAAAFAPDSSNRTATLRDWSVQLGSGVEHHHSSSVLLRDASTGKTTLEIKPATGAPLAWSPDARWIAAREGDHRMGIWDASTGALIGRVVSHIDTVTHTAFTPDNMLVTLSRDGTLRITNPLTSRTVARLEIEGNNNPRALRVSTSGRTIVSIWGTSVHIWHPGLGGDVTSYSLGAVRATEGWPLCISPDGRYLACRTEDGFDVMEVSSGAVVSSVESGVLVTAGAFSPDSSVLLLGRMDGVVEVWDLEERKR